LPNTAFLQVSGLTVVYDPTKPRDRRLISLTSPQGAIQPEEQYEVVMPLFLAQGGSGYFQIFDKDNIVRRGTTGLADAIFQYLQANPDRNYTGQGRIVRGG
jgi:2',3'-cyclic-nucleotide 2'-phosphodiesterase (5'-nucleotidase family)